MTDRLAARRLRSRVPGGLLIVSFFILVLLLAYQLWLSYQDSIRTAEIATRNFAEIFEARLQTTLRRTDVELKLMADELPLAALHQKAVPVFQREVNSHLDSRLFNLEEMADYRVHDANGNTLYSSNRGNVANVNIADRAYFQRLRDDPGTGLLISDVLESRVTGRQVLVIARALRDEHGKFMGGIFGLLELEYYRKQFQLLNLGPEGVIALRRSDTHAQIVRWPDSAADINKPLAADHPVVKRMASGKRALTMHYSVSPENVARVMGIQAMPDYPFYFAVGLGRNAVLAGWREQATVVVVTTLLLLVLLGVLLYRLGRMRVREAGILTTLEQSEAQFRDLAQMVPVGIGHFSAAGRYTYVNDRYLMLAGCRREDLIGRNWRRFVHPDDHVKIRVSWENRGAPGSAFVSDYRFEHPDGQMTYVIGEVRTETDAEGRVLGYIAATMDITQRKKTEADLLDAKQEAEKANISKTRFLAAASHDLRQPIQAINLFRDALSRTELSAEQKTLVNFLSLSVHSLGDLLYSLLDISKLEAGQVTPQMKAVQVEDLFKAVDAEFSPLALAKGLRFKLFYPLKGLVLLTDPALILSALRNLIDNAFKYTELGGVLVGVRKRGNKGVIQIWDTGIGIEKQYGEQIFDECFQIGNQVRDRTKGLGLGLSIARRVASLLNGEVSFRSRPDWGTVFEITLPLAAEGSSVEEGIQQQDVLDSRLENEQFLRFSGWRMVVIEDDLMVAKSIEMALQTLDVSVSVFRNAKEALAWPEIIGADFYISDFRLPGMNGIHLLDAIQKRSDVAINAVLVTGDTSPERIELTGSARWPVLFKPVGLSALLAVMGKTERPGPG